MCVSANIYTNQAIQTQVESIRQCAERGMEQRMEYWWQWQHEIPCLPPRISLSPLFSSHSECGHVICRLQQKYIYIFSFCFRRCVYNWQVCTRKHNESTSFDCWCGNGNSYYSWLISMRQFLLSAVGLDACGVCVVAARTQTSSIMK